MIIILVIIARKFEKKPRMLPLFVDFVGITKQNWMPRVGYHFFCRLMGKTQRNEMPHAILIKNMMQYD